MLLRQLACAAAWLALASAASAEKLIFDAVPKQEIEANLRLAGKNNAARERRLLELFEKAGCTGDRLAEQAVRHSKIPNVICTLGSDDGPIILVGAHTDFAGGIGVIDNWSGASLLAALYRSLKVSPRKHTFVFVGFMGEETGLAGSRYFAEHLTVAEKQRLRAMVNLDSLGLGPTAMWLSHADPELADPPRGQRRRFSFRSRPSTWSAWGRPTRKRSPG